MWCRKTRDEYLFFPFMMSSQKLFLIWKIDLNFFFTKKTAILIELLFHPFWLVKSIANQLFSSKYISVENCLSHKNTDNNNIQIYQTCRVFITLSDIIYTDYILCALYTSKAFRYRYKSIYVLGVSACLFTENPWWKVVLSCTFFLWKNYLFLYM